MAETPIDISLERIKELMNSIWLSDNEKKQISSLFEELPYLRNFLKDSQSKQFDHEKLKDLVEKIVDLVLEAEAIIDSMLVSSLKPNKMIVYGNDSWTIPRKPVKASIFGRIGNFLYPFHRMLHGIRKEVKAISKEVKEIYQQKLFGIGVPHDPSSSISYHRIPSRTTAPMMDETVVGLESEVKILRDLLSGSQSQLDIISIVGMAGLGKTTLAKKLFNDPYIVYHFYVRGWTYVSQAYQKRDMLISILSSIVEHKDGIHMMSNERLGEELYKGLKCKRYLIVLDDIWNMEAWNELKMYFPNDNNGSRILLTTRIKDVAMHAKRDSTPHFLRFLTDDESWELLQQKVFGKESCPLELMDIGRQIIQKCQGLPLAIVVIAGLLSKTEMTRMWWTQVVDSIGPYILSDTKQCLDTLALSYNQLPHHLKLCFLYFGAFPEEYEIPVRKLIYLWIAEGFVQQTSEKSLEDEAEEYLLDLVDRSLVLVAKRRSTGEIKACRIHDVLRDLSMRKAKEERLLQHIYRHNDVSASSVPLNRSFYLCTYSCSSNFSNDLAFLRKEHNCNYEQVFSSCSTSIPDGNNEHHLRSQFRLSDSIFLKSSIPKIRSFLCYPSKHNHPTWKNISFSYQAFKLVRVLDLLAISFDIFPIEILFLVLLRYFAFRGKRLTLPNRIYLLKNLETLIMSEGMGSENFRGIWEMPKLRHLFIPGINKISSLPIRTLHNLQTISLVCPLNSSEFLHMTPSLRKLGFCGSLVVNGQLWFPDLSNLHHLESLKLLNRILEGFQFPSSGQGFNLRGVKFPPDLRRLTLSFTYLGWEEMSILWMLPNLEALKLENRACTGPVWRTGDGGFPKLKYLKMYYLSLEVWDANSSHFPSLECLLIHNCKKLLEIPCGMGDIPTLETIDVSWCSRSTVISAREILKEQRSKDNNILQIFVNPPEWEPEICSSDCVELE